MTAELQRRMQQAIKRIGGTLAVLDLPEDVKKTIVECPDYETRVKMLELVADRLGR